MYTQKMMATHGDDYYTLSLLAEIMLRWHGAAWMCGTDYRGVEDLVMRRELGSLDMLNYFRAAGEFS